MHYINQTIKKLTDRYKKISQVGKIQSILDWDMNVNLPPKGADERATQIAFLTELQTEYWQDPQFKTLLYKAREDGNLTSAEKAMVRNLLRLGKYYFNVPQEIIVEKSETTTKAFMAWQKSKTDDSFKDFLPHLKKVIALNRIIAQHLGYKKNPYDALLELYEPGLTTQFCAEIFTRLKPQLITLLGKIQKSAAYKQSTILDSSMVHYPVHDQKQLTSFILQKMGYDFNAGRVDTSAHPFESPLGRSDVRITTWYHEDDLRDSFYSSMHEAGHALYEQGIDPDYDNTPLEGGVSFAIHESQSRFWENQVGRDPNFIEFIAPIFQAFYPEQLGKVDLYSLTRFLNQVRPGPIRVEADEVTYNLHIALRFELEEQLINNKLQAEDLPEIWKTKMKKYFKIEPANDREGVLQDVHWSLGYFGYFPTYTLGNLYAAQIHRVMRSEIQTYDESLKKGELGTVLYWLRDKIHRHGSMYWPSELIQNITGEKLNPRYFIDYLGVKYSHIYKTELP